MTTCRSCGAPNLWAKTESGKTIPLDDAPPTEKGNIIIRMGPRQGQETAHVETKAETEARLKCPEPAGRTAYVSHYASCPQAKEWRTR
jgi:hypothetical protein